MGVVGYCEPLSIIAGEPVRFHASGSGSAVDVEVVRDSGPAATVWTATGIEVESQPLPADADANGCRWSPTVTIPTETLPTGVYLVRTRDPANAESDPATAYFVVRGGGPAEPECLLVLATNTWNAYNTFGGDNLYTGATVLSFERPLATGLLEKPSGHGERLVDGGRAYASFTETHGLDMWHGMAGWAGQERRFAAWAARSGIELAFAINRDLEQQPDLLERCRLFLSVGHDEYWSWEMRDAVERFIESGGNAAFLSGNTCYWQVRHERDRMICHKHRYTEDPAFGTDRSRRTTTIWSDPIVGRPEAAMTGVSFTRGGYHRIARSVRHGSGGYEVHRPDHWLLDGTRLTRGDQLGAARGTVGYECDGCELTLRDGLLVPTGADGTPDGFEVIATAPATPFARDTTPLPLAPGGDYELEFHADRLLGDASPSNLARLRHGHAVLGTYERGGTVVTAGTTEWAYGLDDPAVDRVTRNIIQRR